MNGSAIAYCGSAPTPAELFGRWNADPVLIVLLLVAAAVAARTSRLDPAGRGRALAGIAVLALLFVSPLCAATSALFSARVVHHLGLVAVAAPLFAAALPRSASPRLGAAPALAIHAGSFWLWHLPALYGWALGSVGGYWIMQATLIVPAVLFWHAVLRGERVAGLLALVAAVAQMGLLGAIITFAGRPLYPQHLLSTAPWGMSPLADQQLAGLLMWVPALIPYALVGGWLLRGVAAGIDAGPGAARDAARRGAA